MPIKPRWLVWRDYPKPDWPEALRDGCGRGWDPVRRPDSDSGQKAGVMVETRVCVSSLTVAGDRTSTCDCPRTDYKPTPMEATVFMESDLRRSRDSLLACQWEVFRTFPHKDGPCADGEGRPLFP